MNVTRAPETIEVTDVARTTSHKILAVEDFPQFRLFVCSLLAQRDEFQVTEACDGLEAVQKGGALQPDLVLLDIGLPNLNGMEVARRISKLASFGWATRCPICSV
jgi:two-component system, chemotaxis family, CheB/CheR fusion protein